MSETPQGADAAPTPKKAPRPLSRKLLFLAIFVGMQGLFLFVVLEIFARVADPMGISYYPQSAKLFDNMIIEEPIGYRFKPGLKGRFHGGKVTINARGMRDAPVSLTPKADEFRVLIMGDSVVYGMGVSDHQTIPANIQKQIKSRLKGSIYNYRVLNMGVPSYNTEQEWQQYQQLGQKLQPKSVALFFTLNDIQPKMWVFQKRSKWYVDLVQRSYGASLLFILLRRVRMRMGKKAKLIDIGAYRKDHPRWQAIETSMAKIAKGCKKNRTKFIVLTAYPQKERAIQMLKAAGKRDGYDVVSIEVLKDPRWKKYGHVGLRNSAVDSHPNPKGTEAFGTLAFEILHGRGFFKPIADDAPQPRPTQRAPSPKSPTPKTPPSGKAPDRR